MDHARDTDNVLDTLTDKQQDVLDLLVLHKTSKQIARELGISPHTVDQRVTAARKKFGVETRSELAAAYMAATADRGDAPLYERAVYQSSQVETPPDPGDQGAGSDTEPDDSQVHADPGKPLESTRQIVQYRVVPESFEGRYGYFWRLTAIVGITLGLLVAALVGLAIFGELSELMQ